MRLLNTTTLELEQFTGDKIPEYAILSHTWGEEEFLFEDVKDPAARYKKGFVKVQGFCTLALRHGFEWVWIDTCCIHKSSSAELSESINSMYHWYKAAHTCYVYLVDVHGDEHSDEHGDEHGDERGDEHGDEHSTRPKASFRASRWWTRGWTLQELIAPTIVEFYNSGWKSIGIKRSMASTISEISGIDIGVLRGNDPLSCNVAQRMSWAAKRETTRIEDMAYCLLGLFDVNMPMLYGERERAFRRLQEEIMKVSEDYSLFAWVTKETHVYPSFASTGLLAQSPADFQTPVGSSPNVWDYSELESIPPTQVEKVLPQISFLGKVVLNQPPTLTARGLCISLPVKHLDPSGALLAFIYCLRRPTRQLLCLALWPSYHDSSLYARLHVQGLRFLDLSDQESLVFKYVTMYMELRPTTWEEWRPYWINPRFRSDETSIICVSIGKSNSPSGISFDLFCTDSTTVATIFELVHSSSRFFIGFGVYRDHTPWCVLEAMDGLSPRETEFKERLKCAVHAIPEEHPFSDRLVGDLSSSSSSRVYAEARSSPKGLLRKIEKERLGEGSEPTRYVDKFGRYFRPEFIYSLHIWVESRSDEPLQVVHQYVDTSLEEWLWNN
jgi:Heterokaryon incompatibility protein (HET)